MSHNSITQEGNLTRDPKFFPASGEKKDFAVCTIACNVGRDKSIGPVYFEVKASGYLAKQVSQLGKGNRVVVSGRIVNDDYTDKEGKVIHRAAIFADEICESAFIAVAKEGDADAGGGEAKEESVGF